MKKRILIMLLSVISLTAFSNNSTKTVNSINNNVSKLVQTGFDKTFPDAVNVSWSSVGEFKKASFEVNGQFLISFFNEQGEQVAISRNLSLSQLPIPTANSLRDKMEGKWLTELFEFSKENLCTYYATLEDAGYKYIIKSENGGLWSLYKKTKKEAL